MTDISVGSVSVDVVPDTRRFATDLKTKLSGLSVDVGLKADLEKFRAQIDEATRDRTATINVDVNTTGANAQIDEAARDRTSKIRVDVDQSALSKLSGSMGLLPATILALGPALVPIAGAVAALGGALAAPLAAAGGGLTVGAIVAGAAAKQTKEQIKQIGELKKKVDSAKQSLATANAAAGASSGNSSAAASRSAANSLAAAQRTHAQSVASARAALANATTPSARASAQLRIQSANATLASRQASVQASLSARQASIAASADTRRAAAQLKVTQATQAYKAALAGLSPAQRKFMDSQAKLKGSFKTLIQTAGPVILGPISKGMNLLAKIMPNLTPLLSGVSGGIETLMKDLGKLASGPEFKAFMSNFGTAAGKAIVDFGRIFGNFGKGLYGLFSALSPLQGGFMSALGTMMQKFADWSSTLDRNKGFQSFLAYIRDVGPKVATTFGDLLRVVGKLGAALAPLGGVVLGAIDGLAKFIITAKPSTLSAIGIAIGGIALALGKGPLGLAFALGATLSHSDRFLSFLKKAGKYVGEIADGFNKLPTWAKTAAGVAVGAGAVGLKLRGANPLAGGKPGGGILGSLLGPISKAKPIPVYVVNDPGAAGGGKKGWLAAVASFAVRTTPYTAPLLTSGDSTPKQRYAGLSPAKVANSKGMTAAIKGLYRDLGTDKFGFKGGRSADAVLAGMLKNDPARGLRILKQAAETAGVSMDKFATDAMPKTQAAVRATERKFGDLGTALDKNKLITHRLASELTGLPKNVIVKLRAEQLAQNLALIQKYGSWLDHLDGRTVKTVIKARLDHNAGQLDRFGHVEGAGATGGIVRRPTVALIGEAGPEAVVPLNRTAGNSPLPRGGMGNTFNHYGDIVAPDPRKYVEWNQQRSRRANGGGVNF